MMLLQNILPSDYIILASWSELKYYEDLVGLH